MRKSRTRSTSQNFASLQQSDPLLYQRLLGSATFTQPQIARNRLLRPFPHMNGLNYNDQPLGIIKAHSLEVVVNRRYAAGLTGNAAFTVNRITENRTVHEFDREPTLWQTNNNGRPWRFTSAMVYELPFGPDKAFLKDSGVFTSIARGWTLGGTFEYQPGALLNWGNLFYNGDLADIAKDNPEIALQPDGTFDATKTWFNTAGFVTAAGDQPTGTHLRVFPFRIDGVRSQSVSYLHANVSRTFALGGARSFVFRRGHAEPAQPAALREPEHGSDQHQLRAGPGRDTGRHAVHHVQHDVPVLIWKDR